MLAERAGAAADLDSQARDRFEFELDYGDATIALGMAALETRKPLPADILQQIRQEAVHWYASDYYRNLVLESVARQEQQGAA